MHVDNITKYTCQIIEVKAAFMRERRGLESHDEANSSAATKTVLEVYNETSDALMAFCH